VADDLDYILDRASTPFLHSSGYLARLVSSGEVTEYVEPLSINGSALLHVEARGSTAKLVVAARTSPPSEESVEEWRLTWSRWARAGEVLRGLGARAWSGGGWAWYSLETPVLETAVLSAFFGAARRVAGVSPYIGPVDAVDGYSLFHGWMKPVSRVHEILIGYVLAIVIGLNTFGEDGVEKAQFTVYLVDNALYMSLEEPPALWGAREGSTCPDYSYATTVSRFYELLAELYGRDPKDQASAPSRPALAKTVRSLEEIGALKRCNVKVLEADCVSRTREAIFFDVRHEVTLSMVAFALAQEDAHGNVDEELLDHYCALLPYVTGATHGDWHEYPGALRPCKKICSQASTACYGARVLEEMEGWPLKPLMPGPCHGTRPIVYTRKSE